MGVQRVASVPLARKLGDELVDVALEEVKEKLVAGAVFLEHATQAVLVEPLPDFGAQASALYWDRNGAVEGDRTALDCWARGDFVGFSLGGIAGTRSARSPEGRNVGLITLLAIFCSKIVSLVSQGGKGLQGMRFVSRSLAIELFAVARRKVRNTALKLRRRSSHKTIFYQFVLCQVWTCFE